MMAALAPADELMADAPGAPLGVWTPVSEPVSIKPSINIAVLVCALILASKPNRVSKPYPNPDPVSIPAGLAARKVLPPLRDVAISGKNPVCRTAAHGKCAQKAHCQTSEHRKAAMQPIDMRISSSIFTFV